jgi:hypothetical protein
MIYPIGRMSGSQRQVNRTEVHFGYMSDSSFLAIKGISSIDIINPGRRNVKQIAKQNPL